MQGLLGLGPLRLELSSAPEIVTVFGRPVRRAAASASRVNRSRIEERPSRPRGY